MAPLRSLGSPVPREPEKFRFAWTGMELLGTNLQTPGSPGTAGQTCPDSRIGESTTAVPYLVLCSGRHIFQEIYPIDNNALLLSYWWFKNYFGLFLIAFL